MRKLIFLIIIVILAGCADNKSKKNTIDAEEKTEQKITDLDRSKKLYIRLFEIIDLNDSGKLPDTEFTPEAKSIKKSLDSLELKMNPVEKETLVNFGQQLQQLLNDLINKKAQRE